MIKNMCRKVYGRMEKDMHSVFDNRTIELAEYISSTGKTVRETAKHFSVSKSTVHKDITLRLPEIDANLFESVRRVLDKNKAERHLRGGLATKEKYREIKHKK